MRFLPTELLLLGAIISNLISLTSAGLLSSILKEIADAVADTAETVDTILTDAEAAIANSITDDGEGYAPAINTCSSSSAYTIDTASASALSTKEAAYMALRKTQTSTALQSFLSTYLDDDVSKYFNTAASSPATGLVFAGGGYRAMLTSAGIFNAMDSRTSTGLLAGFLQSMDYISALSGGTWIVGSSAANGFADVEWLRSNVWHLEDNLVLPGSVTDSIEYLTEVVGQVALKQSAGFEVSITDYWAMCLGHQLISRTDGGPDVLWSNITASSAWSSGSMPFPILVADSRASGELITELNNTIYEINPLEFGSWDIRQPYFYPIASLGTTMKDGKPADEDKCVTQFDVAAFMMATSSSLFNGALLVLGEAVAELGGTGVTEEALTALIEVILEGVAATGDDVADYPNPFEDYNNATSNIVYSDSKISLDDGGTDGETLAFWPLLQPARALDLIFAFDASGDTTYSWPDGTAIVETYERVHSPDSEYQHSVAFPFVPDTNTFQNLGLTTRPTFFGCDAQNYTDAGLEVPAIVVYLANAPSSYYTNSSTYQLSYTDGEVDGFLMNGAALLAQNSSSSNSGFDTSDWPECLACAVVQRAKDRAGDEIGDQCTQCFQKYCWDGTLNTTTPDAVAPVLMNGSDWTYAEQAAVVAAETAAGKQNVLGDLLEDLLEDATST